MFNADFYPTPENVILRMLEGHDITGKIILEPSAGKGNMVDVLKAHGAADVLTCEINADLRTILGTKSRIIGEDFLQLQSDVISHIDFIVMNPPFSADEKHILHAFDIAPAGCRIISLCNSSTLDNTYTQNRRQVVELIEQYGKSESLRDCFSAAERQTGVNISMITLQKPGENYNKEFEGFFMDDTPEEQTGAGLMPYNSVRDLVNRYIGAVKLFDKQLETGVQMNALTSQFYSSSLGFSITEKDKPKSRNDFKKDLQKAAWKYIFDLMNLNKTATRGLKEDINKFVETQTAVPFTMKNVYRMLEIVIGTAEQRMDKALLEVFERVTRHADENKYYGPTERWKTNGYYLLTEKFILPWITEIGWHGEMKIRYNSDSETIDDLIKALCYISGTNYDEMTWKRLTDFCNHMDTKFGEWYCMGFFEIRGYKKGTMHFKFQNQDLWAKFNQRIAKLKGYPLYAHSATEPKKKPEHGNQQPVKPVILSTITI